MILIVDDDLNIRNSLTLLFKMGELPSMAVSTPNQAIAAIREEIITLVIMDMNYSLTTSGEEGLHLLKQIKILRPEIPIILITAWGSIQLAVEGMREGAFDFITKPWNNTLLLNTVKTAIELHQSKETTPPNASLLSHIIGRSYAIQEILKTVAKVAKTNASVLITGESGTGKELIAEAIHHQSKRAGKPFVKVNLGGVSQSLFESEMFGHKRGAFTDAHSDRKGRFTIANGGTIFLDEIGDLDLSCQVKLLRVLQEQTFEVLGESTPKKVDVRVVTATNKNLAAMVSQHQFREDLMYRINLIPIHLPPLRERREDIPLLAQHFATQAAKKEGIAPPTITREGLQFLEKLPWEGNVRELKNMIERAMILSEGSTLEEDDFKALAKTESGAANFNSLEEMEREKIKEELQKNHYNISQTAKNLGLSRAALYRRLEKYQIPYTS